MRPVIDHRGPRLAEEDRVSVDWRIRQLWTKDWNYIPDLQSLGDHLHSTSFVAVDLETYERGSALAREIRFAFWEACPAEISEYDREMTLDDFLRRHSVVTRCIRMNPLTKKEKNSDGSRKFADTQYVDFAEVDYAVYQIMSEFKQRSRGRMVIVGYGIDCDDMAMMSNFTDLSRYFTSWIDLQSIIKDHWSVDYRAPSEALRALRLNVVGPVGKKNMVNPRNGAIQTLAVLLGLAELWRDSASTQSSGDTDSGDYCHWHLTAKALDGPAQESRQLSKRARRVARKQDRAMKEGMNQQEDWD